MNRTQISIEKIMEYEAFRQEVNRCDLKTTDFTLDGEVVEILDKYREDWRFCGMGNWYFIVDGFYKRGFTTLFNPDDESVLEKYGYHEKDYHTGVWAKETEDLVNSCHVEVITNQIRWSTTEVGINDWWFSTFDELESFLKERTP